jgi:predicted AAA+ superfamily ATPase
MIQRTLQKSIESQLYRGKAIVIYGARQVGKTTLVKQIMAGQTKKALFLNADLPETRDSLTNKNAHELKDLVGNAALVVIDEAQRIENIGLTIKILVDTYPEVQIIATGSSSFELANKINEPLTGRSIEYTLFPLTYTELKPGYSDTPISLMERMLRLGSYPGIWGQTDNRAELILAQLTNGVLYKDILEFEQLKKAPLLTQLLQALALQIGSEVSYSELANLLKTNVRTVERYIFLLEQIFVIYRLPALRRNPRREIGQLRKIYFYDIGLRNALIRNHNPTNIRQDTGALWENFCIIERLKHMSYADKYTNNFFWRSASQKEVDLIEEYDGIMHAYEFKWGDKLPVLPKEFAELYPNHEFQVINPQNFQSNLFQMKGQI